MDDRGAARVGQWIRRAREHRSWRQIDLATAANLSPASLSDIENGKQGNVGWRPTTLRALEVALDVPDGTLRKVADGHDIPVDVTTPDDDGQILAVIERLERRIDELSDRVDALGG